MHRFLLRTWTLAIAVTGALALAAPALAQHGGGGEPGGGTGIDVVPPLLWSAVGVAAGAVVFGTLYLFKRQVGGFPEHPEWVAPIEIIPSRSLPSEAADDSGAHGGGQHGDPAHH